ncbi:MAG: hypothetical protein J1F65_01080 [Clostridiales bacterium]|nr:hypothetical protein [Clostridiales bacterium]
MPNNDLRDDIQLSISTKLQYWLSLIPIFGWFFSIFTCLINIRKIKRSAVFSWWIQGLLPVFGFCLLCALLIWLCAVLFVENGVLFAVLAALATYLSLVGMSFGMIFIEKKVAKKLLAEKTANEIPNDEQEIQ